MKTAKEIKESIARKEQKLIDWAIGLIDETSERMFSDAKSRERIRVPDNSVDEFKEALKFVAVTKCVKTNGFKISSEESLFYLEIER